MNNVIEQMLSRYEIGSVQKEIDALREIVQQIALAGLARAGFFEKAAFYGGTCLRIFHGLPRFSEDMDFSLLEADEAFSLEAYFPAIVEEFALLGQSVTITQKLKSHQSDIRSAFLKSETAQYDLQLERGRAIKIKIEVDTTPPLNFGTEWHELDLPRPFHARCVSLPCLFAGKLSALIYRAWQHRVKGRDWYDFEWYVNKGVPMNFTHFVERACEGGKEERDAMTPELMMQRLRARITSANVQDVKTDVVNFIDDPASLQHWSTDYFLSLAEKMAIVAQ